MSKKRTKWLRNHCGGYLTVIPGERKEKKRIKKALRDAQERRQRTAEFMKREL